MGGTGGARPGSPGMCGACRLPPALWFRAASTAGPPPGWVHLSPPPPFPHFPPWATARSDVIVVETGAAADSLVAHAINPVT